MDRAFVPRAALTSAVLFAACSTPRAPQPAAASHDAEARVAIDPCAHVRGGPPGAGSLASDLGRAHALVRTFGVDGDARAADARLADALQTADPSTPAAAVAYARQARHTCIAPAERSALGAATVTMANDVAVVIPGLGAVPPLPSTARAVALDVRALPETHEARDAVLRALAAVVRGDVVLSRVEERICNGQPDEVDRFVARDAEQYACTLHVREERVAGAGRGLPLAVLTAPRLTPVAAWAAVSARAGAGAIVIGDDVPTAVAESRWVGVGDAGLAVRVGRLVDADGRPLPDVIRADSPTGALAARGWPVARPPPSGPAVRAAIEPSAPPGDWAAPSTRVGDGRAALVTAYAATRTFFPYLDEIDDVFDARLDECLAILAQAPDDRATVRKALRRFGEALHDGHAHVYDDAKLALWGAPVALVPVGDDLVVAASTSPAAKRGDVVFAQGGTPIATWASEAAKYASGSPQAVRAGVAERLIQAGTPIEVRRAGETRTITIPQGTAVATTDRIFEREAGPLADLGAPDVFYLTLDASSPYGPNARNVAELEARMDRARGVILDLRGYPSRAAWAILAHVASQASRGPKMAELVVTPASRAIGPFLPLQELRAWTTETRRYDGPVIVLTGPKTQSQAEHWLSFFRSERRGKVVGGRTSGANGTITGVQLPGGYGLTFTGMLVRHTDGARFHAIGHVPDIEVEPTIDDLRRGRDTVLLRALAELDRDHPRR